MLTYSFSGEVSQIRRVLRPRPTAPSSRDQCSTPPLSAPSPMIPACPTMIRSPHYGYYPGAATLSYTVGTLSYSSVAWIAVGDSVSSLPLVSGVRGYDTPQGPLQGDWMIVEGG